MAACVTGARIVISGVRRLPRPPQVRTRTDIQTYSRKKCRKHKLRSYVGCHLTTFQWFWTFKMGYVGIFMTPRQLLKYTKTSRLSMRFDFI